jgi:hypothetical protein
MQVSTIIALGVLFGAVAAAAGAAILLVTRPYRRARNFLSITITQVIAGGSAVTSIFLLQKVCKAAGIAQDDPRHLYAFLAYAISYCGGGILTIREELRWRKSFTVRDEMSS